MYRSLSLIATLAKRPTSNSLVTASNRTFSTNSAFAMPIYKGGCYCGEVKYTIDVSPDDARTSLCHCKNCKVRAPLANVVWSSPILRSSPEILRNGVRIDDKSPSLVLLLHFRIQEAHGPRSRQWERYDTAPRILSDMRKRYLRSGCIGDEGLSVYYDGDIGPSGRSAAERGILVQEAGEVDAGGAKYIPQARD